MATSSEFREGIYPAAPNQRMLFDNQAVSPASTVFHVNQVVRYCSKQPVLIREEIFKTTFAQLTRRYAILRTRFSLTPSDELKQVVLHPEDPALPFPFEVVDLSKFVESGKSSAEEAETAARTICQKAVNTPFNLLTTVPWRCVLVRVTSTVAVLAFVIHHILVDGVSMKLLLRDMSIIANNVRFNLALPLPPIKKQFLDYVQWVVESLQHGSWAPHVNYYKRKLQGCPALSTIPADLPRPKGTPGDRSGMKIQISAEMGEGLARVAKACQATPFMFLLAVFKVAMYRYNGNRLIVTGTPSANRDHPDYKEVVGYFANHMALVTDMSGNPSFSSFLRERVRSTCFESMEHAMLPTSTVFNIMECGTVPGASPLYQTVFNLQPPKAGDARMSAANGLVDIDPVSGSTGGTNLYRDFSVELYPNKDGGFYGDLRYRVDLFHPSTMTKFWGNYLAIIENVLDAPDTRLDDIYLTFEVSPPSPSKAAAPAPAKSLAAMAAAMGNSAGLHSAGAVTSGSIADMFREYASHNPDSAYAADDRDQMTTKQVSNQANRLATFLERKGVAPGQAVGLLMEDSLDLVVGMMAVWTVQCEVHLLNGASTRDVLASGKPQVALVLSHHGKANGLTGRVPLVDIDRDWAAIKACPTERAATYSGSSMDVSAINMMERTSLVVYSGDLNTPPLALTSMELMDRAAMRASGPVAVVSGGVTSSLVEEVCDKLAGLCAPLAKAVNWTPSGQLR